MGVVVDIAEDALDDFIALNTIVLINMFPGEALVLAYLCDSCEHFMSQQIGVTLGWLGITDADIITVEVQDQLLITDSSFYDNLMVQVAIEHQRSQRSIIELLSIKSQGVRGSMNKYSSYGKTTYLDGEPATSINTMRLDEVVVSAAITDEVGESIALVEVEMRVPTEVEWIAYNLTVGYDYNPATNTLQYSGLQYTLVSKTYNFSTGKYDVTISRDCTETETTTITVTNIDATTDNVHKVINTTVVAYEGIISNIDVITDTVVPIGTVSNSVTVVTTDVFIDTVIVYVDGFIPNMAYVAYYTKGSSTDVFYWIYFVGTGNTELDNARNYLTDLDMLPIIELRSNNITITEDKLSTRYKQSKEILGFIGIDVDVMCDSIENNPNIASIAASYIYFGAELGSNDPIQAELIYAMLEYVYDDPTLVTGAVHTIRIQEGNYNSSLSWELQERIPVNRTGVPIGTYEGGVGTIELTEDVLDEYGTVISTNTVYKYYGYVRKQVTDSYYIEYRIYNVSAITLIAKGGMYDTTFKVLAPDVVIVFPLSIHFLTKLAPIEQGKVFPNILRLATYSADIQHLEYYQTPEFATLVQIVAIIIAIVVFIFSWGNYGLAAAVYSLLIGMAIGYALTLLLSMTDNPYLKAALVIIAVIVAVETGDATGVNAILQNTVFAANLLSEAVTQYSEHILEEGYAALQQASNAFNTASDKAYSELDTAGDILASIISTEEMQKLTRQQDIKSYIEGYDLQRYRASVDFMCNWELVKSMKIPTGLYDYDKQYIVGIMNLT